ncbi:MAG: TIGR01841 family phasin [Pseudomonadota bacterium]
MFGKLSEQLKKSAKPASTLFEMNAKALGEIASQQTQFFTGVITDSKKLVETVSEQSELKGILAAQSVYAESVRERVTSTSKSTYGTLTSMREEVTGLVKTSIEDVTADAKAVVENAVSEVSKAVPAAKKPAAKKPAAKKPAAKKVAAKPAAKKPAAKKAAPAKATAPEKASPTPESTPAVKPKAKVAALKADEVKAASKD